jgi:hypothetical protein
MPKNDDELKGLMMQSVRESKPVGNVGMGDRLGPKVFGNGPETDMNSNWHPRGPESIELEVCPAFGLPLTVKISEGVLTYEGNISLENSLPSPEASGALEISPSLFAELISDILTTQIPAVPEYIMGLDGETYTLRISNGFNQVTFAWWSECPRGWKEIGALADRMIDLVKRSPE